MKITTFFDQSLFVRAAIQGVLREALIAACLTAVMILLFLGNWKSTLIIAISIPLSILVSMLLLSALGETINIMTLGGLALAVGILVDDATVEIENINRNLAMGKETVQAILDGAQQIAVPAFVSTLCICIVFVPMFFLSGVARYLFVPLAEAVIFRDAGVVHVVANDCADDGDVSVEFRGRIHRGRASGEQQGFFRRYQQRFRAQLSSDFATATGTRWSTALEQLASVFRVFPRLLPAFLGLLSFRSGAGISFRRWTPGRSACTCERAPDCESKRRAHWRTRSKQGDPANDPGKGSADSARQHRAAVSAVST